MRVGFFILINPTFRRKKCQSHNKNWLFLYEIILWSVNELSCDLWISCKKSNYKLSTLFGKFAVYLIIKTHSPIKNPKKRRIAFTLHLLQNRLQALSFIFFSSFNTRGLLFWYIFISMSKKYINWKFTA